MTGESHGGDHMNSSGLGRLVVSAVVLGAALAAFTLLSGGSERGVVASGSQPALYSPGEESGEMSPAAVEQYWQNRLSYPTGHFNERWIAAAAKQSRRITAGIPAGYYRGRRAGGGRLTSALMGAKA